MEGHPVNTEPGGHEVHVIPRNDRSAHPTVNECPCVPRTEPVEREDGTIGWVVIHNALDGRE